jgi:hypothetical protein
MSLVSPGDRCEDGSDGVVNGLEGSGDQNK